MNLLPVFHLFFFFLLWKQDTVTFSMPLPQFLAQTSCHWACPRYCLLPKQRQCGIMTPTWPTCHLFSTTPLGLGVHLPILTETLGKMRNSVHLMELHTSCIWLWRVFGLESSHLWYRRQRASRSLQCYGSCHHSRRDGFPPLPPQDPSIPPRWGKTSIFLWPVQPGNPRLPQLLTPFKMNLES